MGNFNLMMDKLDKITKDDYFMSEVEALQWAEWEKCTIYNDGKQDGIEENTRNIIKNM